MATRAEKIRRMERTVKDYERNNPGSTKAVKTAGDEPGFLDKMASAAGFLKEEVTGKARRLKSGVQTRQKLQAKRGAKYVKTMQELKK